MRLIPRSSLLRIACSARSTRQCRREGSPELKVFSAELREVVEGGGCWALTGGLKSERDVLSGGWSVNSNLEVDIGPWLSTGDFDAKGKSDGGRVFSSYRRLNLLCVAITACCFSFLTLSRDAQRSRLQAQGSVVLNQRTALSTQRSPLATVRVTAESVARAD